MRRLLTVCFLSCSALWILACTTASEPGGEAAVASYSIEDFLATTRIFGASFSPDGGTLLVSSDATGVFNAYAVPVAGGEGEQLTSSSTDGVRVESYFPADRRFVYTSDHGGDERTHVYVRELDGSVTDLTPGEGLKASFDGWAADDRSFFVSTNERDDRFFDVYEVTVDGYRRTLLYQDDTGYQLAAISPDKRYLAFAKSRTTSDGDIYLFDREAGAMRHLTPHEGEVAFEPQAFDPAGENLYYTSDEGGEFRSLRRYDLAGGTSEEVLAPPWDVAGASFSKGGHYLVVTVNADARNEVHLYDAATLAPVPLPQLPEGDVTSVTLSPDERSVAFYVSSSKHPSDLFVAALAGGAPRQLTHSLGPKIDPDQLVEGEVVRFASYDGVEIPGILYTPYDAGPEAKAPALLRVHGGPGGQSRLNYDALTQYLVHRGYVIYAINNRGSSGYGKTFYRMDDRAHGEADLDDCVASKAMLVATGAVDPERIGILGGSYGGYMVLAALAFRPEEFAVGVDLFGVANWVRTLESIPPWWESFRQALYVELGDPAVDGDYLRRISPLFHAENIVRPLIVLQGANDPRVLKVESDEIVAAVRARGVPVDYLVFDDEGHGFQKKENQRRGYRAIREFLDRYLKGETPSAV